MDSDFSLSEEFGAAVEPGEVKWGLPREVVHCRRCVMSNQMPSAVVEIRNSPTDRKPTLNFDADGVCHACKYAELKQRIDWREREERLRDLLDRHRRRDGGYDVIVPSSGGKDSAFAAHILKHKYGMNPITVTWAPHIYTDIGWRNFQNLIHAGFDNILVTPNGRVHRKLTRLAFLNLVHPFQPFAIGQRNVAPRLSVEKKIRLVMYGEHAAEYNSKLKSNFNPRMDHSFYAAPRGDLNSIRIAGLGLEQLEAEGVTRQDLLPYLPIDLAQVEENGTEVHHLSYYQKWDPQANFYYAVENVGFEVNPERTEGTYSKYSSLDDKIDGMHYYTTYIKFGIGRASYDAAQEIRNGHITREEGIALVRRYDGEFPQKYYREFLDYIGITEEKFHEVVDSARSPHLWARENDTWVRRHPVR